LLKKQGKKSYSRFVGPAVFFYIALQQPLRAKSRHLAGNGNGFLNSVAREKARCEIPALF